MNYWQMVAGFACLAAGLLAWGLAVALLFARADADEDARAAAVFFVLIAIGCLAFAGVVELS